MLTTNKTGGLQDLFLLLFLTPQISKGVNNDPKDEVEDDDNDNEEEEEVVDNSSREQGLLSWMRGRIEYLAQLCPSHPSPVTQLRHQGRRRT